MPVDNSDMTPATDRRLRHHPTGRTLSLRGVGLGLPHRHAGLTGMKPLVTVPRASTFVSTAGIPVSEYYGHSPVKFRHNLHDVQLFSLQALVKAAARWPEESIEVGDCGTTGPALLSSAKRRAVESLTCVDQTNAWVVLKDVQRDEEYRDVIADVFALLRVLATESETDTLNRAHVFIASNGVETPLHADDNQGFLLHLRGGKMLTLFDMGDRHFSPAIARARAGSDRVFALPGSWPAARVDFSLGQGEGVHIPWQWPHETISTGPGHSISISMSFETQRTRRLLRISNVNDVLVARGMRPRAIGRYPLVDWLKGAVPPVLTKTLASR